MCAMKIPNLFDNVSFRIRPRGLVVLVLVLLAGSAGAAGVLFSGAVSPTGTTGPDANAAEGRHLRSIACVGYVDVSRGVLSLTPTVLGRVVEVAARENERVRAGTTLLRLADDEARADVQQAEANLRAAEAQLTEAGKDPELHASLLAQQKAALEATRHDLAAAHLLATRKEDLARKQLLSPAEVEVAREQVGKLEAAERGELEKLRALELRDPRQDIVRAEFEVRGRQAVLDKARYALRQYTVQAPVDGEVLRVLTQPGDVFGSQSRNPALLFLPDEPRIVRAEVEQEFTPRLALGQRAEVTDDAVGEGPIWTGRVTRISDWFAPRRVILPDNSQPSDVRTLECLIQIDPSQPQPRIGQRVRVKLYFE
jgi:multidrug resistance efflux pump